MNKTFICLANSRKSSGHCIAGKLTENASWFRPISSRATEEISEIEMRYENGDLPKLLDIIQLEVKQKKPNLFQNENYLIDTNYYWVKVDEYTVNQLAHICDNKNRMWTCLESSYQGINDRINSNNASALSHSLVIIAAQNSTIIVRLEGAEFGNPKRKVRLKFMANQIQYILPITHPEIEREYLGKLNGEYPILNEHYLVISLGLPHTDGYCYLFAAAIIK